MEQISKQNAVNSSASHKEFSIVAKKRPPPMVIAYNEEGID